MEYLDCFAGICGGSCRELVARRRALRRAKEMVKEIVLSKSCGPILVRAAWQDAGTFDVNARDKPWPEAGGAIGSLINDHELNAEPNRGLKKAINMYLKPIKEQNQQVSWADLLQLSSATAIEVMGGPKIPMRYGRIDGTPANPAPSPFGLPDPKAENPAEHLRWVFCKYGMNDKDIVALSGAHTIGRAFKERSGAVEDNYVGGTVYTKRGCPYLGRSETAGGRSWTKEWLTFDNSYFTDMGNGDAETVTLPTDRVLMEDPGFKPYFEAFKADQAAFFAAYATSHRKLSELGSKFQPARGITGV